jgi:hypothetical protein
MRPLVSAALAAAGLLVAVPAASAAEASAQRTQVLQQAPNSFAATVESAPKNGQITVKPSSQAAATTLRIGANAPVFQKGGAIRQSSLFPGTPVRVHYRAEGGTPEVLGLDVLTNSEFEQAKKEQQELAALTGAAAPAPGTTAEAGKAFREKAEKKASGNQAGTIVQAQGGTLVLDPYQKAAGEATLSLESNTPVFKGDTQIAVTELKPGADVRVFFKEQGGKAPKVVAVEVLEAQEAKKIREAEADVPNRSND